jgi:hypothetical protein
MPPVRDADLWMNALLEVSKAVGAAMLWDCCEVTEVDASDGLNGGAEWLLAFTD